MYMYLYFLFKQSVFARSLFDGCGTGKQMARAEIKTDRAHSLQALPDPGGRNIQKITINNNKKTNTEILKSKNKNPKNKNRNLQGGYTYKAIGNLIAWLETRNVFKR